MEQKAVTTSPIQHSVKVAATINITEFYLSSSGLVSNFRFVIIYHSSIVQIKVQRDRASNNLLCNFRESIASEKFSPSRVTPLKV